MTPIVAINLRYLRRRMRMTQEDLSEKIYRTRASYQNWEGGRYEPDINSLTLLSEIFQVSVDELIKVNIQEKEKKEQGAEMENHEDNKTNSR